MGVGWEASVFQWTTLLVSILVLVRLEKEMAREREERVRKPTRKERKRTRIRRRKIITNSKKISSKHESNFKKMIIVNWILYYKQIYFIQ